MKVLLVDTGDHAGSLDSSLTDQIAELVKRYFPGSTVDFLSSSLVQIRSVKKEGGEKIAEIIHRMSMYGLVIAYFPEALMLNAIMVWQAYNDGVPVIVFSSMNKHKVVSAIASDVVTDLAELEDLLARLASEKAL